VEGIWKERLEGLGTGREFFGGGPGGWRWRLHLTPCRIGQPRVQDRAAHSTE